MKIKRRRHGSIEIFWTDFAVMSSSKIIGFYFDDLGIPQQILRNSLFGNYIVAWNEEKS